MRVLWRGLRTALLIVGISLLLLEATLQLAAQLVEKRKGLVPRLPVAGTTRIVTLGDSNTYGLYLQAAEAWPALLETAWNQRYPLHPVQVINLGFPGTNSSRLLKSVPEVISTFTPDILLVMVGVNDFWTAPVDVGEQVNNLDGQWERWLRDHSRAYKLAFMLWRQFSYNSAALHIDDEFRHTQYDAQGEAQFKQSVQGAAPAVTTDKPSAIHYGDTAFDIGYVFAGRQQQPVEAMHQNLYRTTALAQQHGIRLVFVTYPYFEQPQKAANQQMKVAGKAAHVPVINVARVFRTQCQHDRARCQALFFPDFHPSAEGSRVLAQHVLDALPPALAGKPMLDTADD